MDSRNFSVRFLKKIQRTEDVYSFYFKRPEDFEFTAGQYNRWIIPIENPDERGNNRYFTISSSPYEKDFLMITTKISVSSFKKTLMTFEEGQEIEIFGPLGKFVLGDSSLHDVFVAGGIGITPYHSMIMELAHGHWNSPITLFSSFSTSDEVIFHDEFTEVAGNHNWFKYLPTVSRLEESKKTWEGLTGRIDQQMIKDNIDEIAKCVFYLCGPPAMVDALKKTVEELGIQPDRVKVEKFTGY